MKLKNTLGIAIGTLLAATTFNVYAQGKGAVEIDASAKRFWTNGRKMGDGYLYGGTIGYYLTKDVELALSYGGYHDMRTKRNSPSDHKKVHGNFTSLDAIYNFGEPGVGWRPYVSGGVGHQNITNSRDYNGRRMQLTTANLGGGVKYYFTESFFAKASVDAQYGIEKRKGGHHWEYLAGLGLGMNFGGEKPAPAPVPDEVCVDSDNDGICDNLDKCLNTPPNVNVDGSGCPIVAEAVRVQLDVKFDFNKSVVKPEYYSDIQSVADFMKQYPQTTTTVNGHTDAVGGEAYNQRLSERRANAVRDVLVNELGIEPTRVQAVGHGKLEPIATNDTAEGRALNRRVEATVESQEGQPQ